MDGTSGALCELFFTSLASAVQALPAKKMDPAAELKGKWQHGVPIYSCLFVSVRPLTYTEIDTLIRQSASSGLGEWRYARVSDSTSGLNKLITGHSFGAFRKSL
jgi:hypothetical protein